MTCEEITGILADYLQGGMAAEESARVREHIEQCAACREDVAMWQKLEAIPDEKPSPELGSRFNTMLESYQQGRWEKGQLAREHGKFLDLTAIANWARTPALSLAWAAVLVVCSFFAGRYLHRDHTSAEQLTQLRMELRNTQQLMVVSMLRQQSASERLQGVSFSRREEDADPKVLDALLHTLRYDNSVDVRLAALDVLSRYGNRPEVHQGLIEALQGQQSPLVQLSLIDVLVEQHGPGTAEELKQFKASPGLDPSVRKRVEWGIQQLS
ncbi:MAG TPA: zf-HC2 domain-containing protein [Candidatus Angelobacter sp.]|nr:zf-HC2 domain-containing protein [Candidatus Angelobacter sp.]